MRDFDENQKEKMPWINPIAVYEVRFGSWKAKIE